MSGEATAARDDARRRCLAAALDHVAFDGWTERALRAGAATAGLDGDDVARLFPGGGLEAVDLFMAEGDRRMVAALEGQDQAASRLRDRIAAAVRARLEPLDGHREAVRQAATLLALPGNAPRGLRALYRTVDAMWRAAGDRSADFNFYTKRMLLGGVYGATLLFWLDDRSDDCRDTWDFLDRRIADIMRLQKARARLVGLVPDFAALRRRAAAPRRRRF